MARASDARLLSLLRTEGPQSPASLMNQLGVSQPTLFRAAKAQPDAIVALGGPRNRKLAALRIVRGVGPKIPVFLISNAGEVRSIGNLIALHPSSYALQTDSDPLKPAYYPGLPYFLDDIRPQGFLGRAFALKHLDLGLPARILDWTNDDVLEAIARRGEDLIGNLLVGAESFERYQKLRKESIEPVKADAPESKYLKYAQAAIDGDLAGSSAGGEHPKFGATLKQSDGSLKRVLVKFSPAGTTFAAQRWRDLLISEEAALKTLQESGISAAECRIVKAGERIFLETTRFDRVGAYGRVGLLSLAALENEWIGRTSNWAHSADLLDQMGKISADDLETIRILECFGRLIANSDRHPGNLSFFWQPGDEAVRLAPAYDMLPMLYAPTSGGEDASRVFELPTYDHTLLSAWKLGVPMAARYWSRLCDDPRLSKPFRLIAEKNLKVVNAAS